mmetsp:Transcript_2172/g.2779  ORF Transcript_2172/g.2779 Transcript_2172/m.2779 type:complete len:80 (+) Transcript_2172:105-344(+)
MTLRETGEQRGVPFDCDNGVMSTVLGLTHVVLEGFLPELFVDFIVRLLNADGGTFPCDGSNTDGMVLIAEDKLMNNTSA